MPDTIRRDVAPCLGCASYAGRSEFQNPPGSPRASPPKVGHGNQLRQPATRAGRGEVFPPAKKLHQGVYFKTMRPKKIILCVDDNEQELSVLKFMLATNGYRVVSATNGQDAIGIFAETPVDLVLADYGLPQMNGSQLVGRLKEIAAHVPMILLGDPQRMARGDSCRRRAAGQEELLVAGTAGAHQGNERPQARAP